MLSKCSWHSPLGAAIHIDCDIVNYVTYCGTIIINISLVQRETRQRCFAL